jgi:hypothetical protein
MPIEKDRDGLGKNGRWVSVEVLISFIRLNRYPDSSPWRVLGLFAVTYNTHLTNVLLAATSSLRF